MACECVSDFAQAQIDHRPRKRPRWDVDPLAQIGMFSEKEALGDLTNFVSSILPLYDLKVTQKAFTPKREDDKDGRYMFKIGDDFTPRYKIYRKMGEGTFGQVLECWDRESKEMVAIKIVRAVDKYREDAMIEIDVLQQLKQHSNSSGRCVQIRNWFDYCNHVCIVFEKLGPSLYDFLKKNDYRPFPIDLVRELGKQLLESIAFMHDLNLIHTDLKPENILFVSPEYIKVSDHKAGSCSLRLPKSSAIKVIDFGSTTNDSQDHSYVISTRHYRAPEVILGSGWSYPCDIWSVGCIIAELCTVSHFGLFLPLLIELMFMKKLQKQGEALFQTHEDLEHLAMMEKTLGPLPQHVLQKADRHGEKYIRRGRLNWPEGAASRDSIKAVSKLHLLEAQLLRHVDRSIGDLMDLLEGLLEYEPSRRLTAHEALRHPFFTKRRRSRS